MTHETFISVDIEASGPIPSTYSMLTLGACLIDDPVQTFEMALKPTTTRVNDAAMAVTGLSLEELERRGEEPEVAMTRFAEWIQRVVPENSAPVFVGFNAGFDWAFVNHYFLTFLGRNPFGFAPLDVKALYMGATGSSWSDTRSSVMRLKLGAALEGDHVALTDAVAQAELFRLVRQLSGNKAT